MNNELKRIVVAAAKRARAWAQAEAGPHHNLCGWCAKASARLYAELSAHGIKPAICMTNTENQGSHVFLLLDDHVVDVTATQFQEFENKPVVIMHSKEAEQHYFYQPSEMFDTPARLRSYQRRHGWPEYQMAQTS